MSPPRICHALPTCVVALVLACAVQATTPIAVAQSESVVVTAEVEEVLNLDVSACATAAAGVTDLGQVIAGEWIRSGSDCTIDFGSNSGVTSLQLRQTDGAGVAMFRPSTGQPDPEFGAGGHLVVDVDAAGGTDEASTAIQLDDGSLMIGGKTIDGGNAQVFVSRYDQQGVIDPSWGTGGTVLHSYSPGALDGVNDMALQPDGKIITVSHTANYNFVLHRFNADGSGDASFYDHPSNPALDGQRPIYSCQSPWEITGKSVALDLDAAGNILTAGNCNFKYSALQRYVASGTLDASFNGGNVRQDFCPDLGAPRHGGEAFEDVLVLADGAVLAAGWCETSLNSLDAHIVRISDDGKVDTGFSGGQVTIDFGTNVDRAHVLYQQPDGAVLVGGGDNDGHFQLRRIDPESGAIDTSFGTGGVAEYQVGDASTDAYVRGMSLEFDGRILVAGDAEVGATREQVVLRLTPDGDLDTTFNATGELRINHGSTNSAALDVAAAADGQIIVSGTTEVGTARRATVTRLDSDTIPQYGGASSRWSARTDGFFATCVRAVAGDATADVVDWPATAGGVCETTTASDNQWNAVPTGTAIELAQSSGLSGVAHLNFAVAAAAGQSTGSYVAPVTVELIAVT